MCWRGVSSLIPTVRRVRVCACAWVARSLIWACRLLRVCLSPRRFRSSASTWRSRLATFASERWRDWECRRLAERIRKHLDELLVWLVNPAVRADNNMAERALRPAVVTRKTSFGSRSKHGAQAASDPVPEPQAVGGFGQDRPRSSATDRAIHRAITGPPSP